MRYIYNGKQYDENGLPVKGAMPKANPYYAPPASCATPQPPLQPQVPIPQPMSQQFAHVPAPQQSFLPAYPAVQKNRILAVFAAFLFGSFGLHNFYLGYNKRGLIQLSLMLFGCMTFWLLIGFVPIMIVSVWAFVDFIMLILGTPPYDRDANGMPF